MGSCWVTAVDVVDEPHRMMRMSERPDTTVWKVDDDDNSC